MEKLIKNSFEKDGFSDDVYYSENSGKKSKKSSDKKQQSIKYFLKKIRTPSRQNVLKSWNSKSQKKVTRKYIKANKKKEHSAVQLKPARNKSKSIAKLQKYSFKKIILKKMHKKNNDFFNLKEDYFLLISEYVFAFPELGFKNLKSFLQVIANNTGRTLKSVQRRREKLKKLSRLQIWVIENFIVRFLPRVIHRKILNLKYENINIIKSDNTDIPENEKQFLKNLIQNYEHISLEPNVLESLQRKRGRPQVEKTQNLQEKCSMLDIYDLYNPWIIEDLKQFLFANSKGPQQLKLTDTFFQHSNQLKKKDFSSTIQKSSTSDAPIINKDISIMSLLNNSVKKSTKDQQCSTKNTSIKSFFSPVENNKEKKEYEKVIKNEVREEEVIKEEKSELENSKFSKIFGSFKQLILSNRKEIMS